MFTEMEFKIFKQLSEHEDLRIIFVLTYSSEKTDHKELIDMINTGIKGCLQKALDNNKINEIDIININF
jgi:hypothetical protein